MSEKFAVKSRFNVANPLGLSAEIMLEGDEAFKRAGTFFIKWGNTATWEVYWIRLTFDGMSVDFILSKGEDDKDFVLLPATTDGRLACTNAGALGWTPAEPVENILRKMVDPTYLQPSWRDAFRTDYENRTRKPLIALDDASPTARVAFCIGMLTGALVD